MNYQNAIGMIHFNRNGAVNGSCAEAISNFLLAVDMIFKHSPFRQKKQISKPKKLAYEKGKEE